MYKITADRIRELNSSLPEIILERHFSLNPGLAEIYNKDEIFSYLQDCRYHLSFLAEAVENEEPALFYEYIRWIKSVFSTSQQNKFDIAGYLIILRDTLVELLYEDPGGIVEKYINEAIGIYLISDAIYPSFIIDSNPYAKQAEQFLSFLIKGDKNSALELILGMVKSDISVKDIYNNIFQVTQKEVGRLWQIKKISVAHEHFVTAATQLIMAQLYPYMFTRKKNAHKIIVVCVSGELHEIGARMVADIFELEGWDSYYYGANTPAQSVINALIEHKPDVIAISVTMVFNLKGVKEIIDKIKESPELKNLKIIVGGYPFSIADNLWQKYGADAYASDASSAITVANNFVSKGTVENDGN